MTSTGAGAARAAAACPAGCVPAAASGGEFPLEVVAGASALAELVLTAVVLLLGRDWKGVRRGAGLDPRVCVAALCATVLLALAAAWNAGLMVYRLAVAPDAFGNKDELGITAAAFAALWYTDVMRLRRPVRRRRAVAELVARLPTFRFGPPSRKSPSAGVAGSELVVRSASWSLRSLAPMRDYWRGKVAFAGTAGPTRGGGGGAAAALVVLFDHTAQDEAGADLLTPEFTHASEMSKQLVADVVWAAIVRAGLWNIDGWESGFATRAVGALAELRGVQGIRAGELWRRIPGTEKPVGAGRPGGMPENQARELCEVIWAAVTLEVLGYLAKKRAMILLPALVDIPLSIRNAESAEWPASAMLEFACESFVDVRG